EYMPDTHALERFWFEFDLDGLAPPPSLSGTVTLDGGTAAYRFCSGGAGVTGYDQADGDARVDGSLARITPTRAARHCPAVGGGNDCAPVNLRDFPAIIAGNSRKFGVIA